MARKAAKFDFNKMRSMFFFGVLILLSTALLYIFQPFFYPIFWAAVIAILFFPLFKFLERHIKIPSISSLITVILVIVILFLPLALISILTIYQSTTLYESLRDDNFFQNVSQVTLQLNGTPLEPVLEKIRTEWTSYAADATRAITSYLFNSAKQITENSLKFLFMLFVMLYTLYYFLKDGKKIIQKAMRLSPLGDEYEHLLCSRFVSTTRATLKSTVIVGGIQGILGGLLFWIAGIPGAFIWGVIMVVLSIIPAVGSFIVWFPAGIIMLALGFFWQGIMILLFGGIIISTIDNLLRPPLIGKDIEMHPLIVLFSTLGGLIVFGISGFVIGPIIAALLLSVLSIYQHFYQKELAKN